MPKDRPKAFRKLINLLKPGGVVAISLRHGGQDQGRNVYDVSVSEIEGLSRAHGAFVERCVETPDLLGRENIRWTQMVIKLPDDGTGTLPLLRSIVINDNKSSTYKLALLKTLSLIARSSAGYVSDQDDESVSIPFGLVGLYWIRLFKPLLAAELPQSPDNKGLERLGFVKQSFENLMQRSGIDFRIGERFIGVFAADLHNALRDACSTIAKMPATYITYPQGGKIFSAGFHSPGKAPSNLLVEKDYLQSFGDFIIPGNIWRALMRFGPWIEPAIDAEWIRIMKGYAESQRRIVDEKLIHQAMSWNDPKRDTTSVRKIIGELLLERRKICCIWSEKTLTEDTAHVDHCLPWAVWPCSDLWNLFPAHKNVNNNKRDFLPSAELIDSARDRIAAWWENAYQIQDAQNAWRERFHLEARATLPGLGTLSSEALHAERVINAIQIQRLRLKQDQQVAEWSGMKKRCDGR